MTDSKVLEAIEKAYRRGYCQGASKAFEAAKALLGFPRAIDTLEDWIINDLRKWRSCLQWRREELQAKIGTDPPEFDVVSALAKERDASTSQ